MYVPYISLGTRLKNKKSVVYLTFTPGRRQNHPLNLSVTCQKLFIKDRVLANCSYCIKLTWNSVYIWKGSMWTRYSTQNDILKYDAI